MKVKYSALMSGASGKLNGSVASRNKGGDYFRTKVTPVNPRTSFQTLQRAYLATLSSAWNTVLGDSDRTAWTAYGQTIGQLNIFGDNLILSGIATFVKVNQIILTAGGTMITTPPATNSTPGLLTLSVLPDSTTNHIHLDFTPTPLVAPQGLYVFATPPLSPGIGNFNNRLRYMSFYSAAATNLDIVGAWVSRFGSLPAGGTQRLGVRAFVVDVTTGAISAAAQSIAVIA